MQTDTINAVLFGIAAGLQLIAVGVLIVFVIPVFRRKWSPVLLCVAFAVQLWNRLGFFFGWRSTDGFSHAVLAMCVSLFVLLGVIGLALEVRKNGDGTPLA